MSDLDTGAREPVKKMVSSRVENLRAGAKRWTFSWRRERSLASLGMTPFFSSMLRVDAHCPPQQNCHLARSISALERSEGPFQPPLNPYAIALHCGGGDPNGGMTLSALRRPVPRHRASLQET